MEPLYFGSPNLFGVYHPALAAASRPRSVLICPSIGHEHTRSHRALRTLAEALARAGHHVLRFDYSGMGDSAGEFEEATVERWTSDIRCAAEEVGALSGIRDLYVVGVRMGAALAVNSLGLGAPRRRGGSRVSGFVLWDPLLAGRDFLECAKLLTAAFLRDADRFPRLQLICGGPRPRTVEGMLGYRYSEDLVASLKDLDVGEAGRWPRVPTHVVLSEPQPAHEEFCESLRESGRLVTSVRLHDGGGGWSDYHRHEKALRAGLAARTIVDLVGSATA